MSDKKPGKNEFTRLIPEGDTFSQPSAEPADDGGGESYTVPISATRLPKVDISDSTGFARASAIAKRLGNSKLLNNRFALVSELGHGGMGVVYKAKDLIKEAAKDSNPWVAVKVLGGNFKDHPDAFITFQREARKSQSLSHPNIVRVHDFDRDIEKGVVYMTMEYLEGMPLDKIIKQNPEGMPRKMVWKILLGVAEALKHAHDSHLVHCDLKPGNIFITKDGTPKVLDFGISRAMHGPSADTVFDAGSLGAMTPGYASLEMIEHQKPHPSDDIYALALVTYVMLTGRHPFLRLPANEAKARRLKPKRIPGLSRKQWRMLEKGLAFDRKDRIESADIILKTLTQSRRMPIFGMAASLVFAGILTGLYYNGMLFNGNEELRQRIAQTLAEARRCLQEQQYGCAQRQAEVVLSLNANHPDAIGIAQQAKERLKAQQEAERDNALRQKIADYLTIAEQCLLQAKFDCSTAYAEEIVKLDAQNKDADFLKQRVATAIAQRQAETEQARAQAQMRQMQIETALLEGNRCLQQNNFKCATQKVGQVKGLDARNIAAISLQEQIRLAERQQRIQLENIKNILNEGELCFTAVRYDCAIAKAESVLRLNSQDAKALSLKQRAVQAQKDVLKRMVIE